ncbi:MAG: bypass of forespore [Paenibacillus sp.]|jgi:forespore regulator of the sigma-K checkpoint|nr:bypass of forespore [Paenibacillus sp.]
MDLSSFFKQLKKRLRQKRRWLSLGFFIVAVAVGLIVVQWTRSPASGRDAWSALTPTDPQAAMDRPMSMQDRIALGQIAETGGMRDVYIRKVYVCGEESLLLGRMEANEVLSMSAEHPTWQVELADDGVVTFVEQIDDLSPACKHNAYFGVDKTGNLSLFEGPPDDEKVIRTFFQLNIGYLESSLQPETIDQLKQGIRVLDMEEYNSVLSTFSEFAIEETEHVMKQ